VKLPPHAAADGRHNAKVTREETETVTACGNQHTHTHTDTHTHTHTHTLSLHGGLMAPPVNEHFPSPSRGSRRSSNSHTAGRSTFSRVFLLMRRSITLKKHPDMNAGL